jgi:hypothetical protein
MRARLNVRWKRVRSGGSSPIPFEELVEVSAATIAVEEAIAGGKSVWLGATGSTTGASKPR